MRRRGLILAIASGIALSPLLSEAQQPGKTPQIGVLWLAHSPADDAAFRQRLKELGYIDGRTIRIEVRSAGGRIDRLPALAHELVDARVGLIVAVAATASRAARDASSTIPVVMVLAGDPVGSGLVKSLAHPSGNVTGTTSMTPEIAAKQVELLHETVPSAVRLAIILNPTNPGTPLTLRNAEDAAHQIGLQTTVFEIEKADDFTPIFAAITQSGVDALYVQGDPVLAANRHLIIEFAARARLPTMYALGRIVRDGGLISYTTNMQAHFARAADYVDRILKGAKPTDLPIEQPTEFLLIVNLKAALAIGLTIPPAILARADEVIE